MLPREPQAPASLAGKPIPSIDPDRDLANIAVGASNVLLLGSLCTLLLGLFPLRWGSSEWQLSQMGNVVANGTWILLGLVLLHLGVRHQPSKGRWVVRLAFLRRLSVPMALAFLLLAPLQLIITWQGIETARSNSSLSSRATLARVEAVRRVIVSSGNLQDLRYRLKVVPGAPPIPEEAASLPFPTLRRTLLNQLDTLAGSVRDQMAALQRNGSVSSVWRQTARNAFSSLLLAFGFASVSRGASDAHPLITALLALPRTLRRSLRLSRHRRGLRSGSERFPQSRAEERAEPPAPASSGFAKQWEDWKRRLKE